MKTLATVLAAVLMASSLPCCAENIDLSAWTCSQYTAANQEMKNLILVWLDGYYKQEDDPPTVDLDQFTGNAKRLGDYCAANPDSTLIAATDKLFQKD